MVFELKHYQGLLRTVGEILSTTEEGKEYFIPRHPETARALWQICHKGNAIKMTSLPQGATMKCEWVQENILLYIYNELADDARYEMEQHLARCTDCAAELKSTRQFQAAISRFPVDEPIPKLWHPPACDCRKPLKPPSRQASGSA